MVTLFISHQNFILMIPKEFAFAEILIKSHDRMTARHEHNLSSLDQVHFAELLLKPGIIFDKSEARIDEHLIYIC